MNIPQEVQRTVSKPHAGNGRPQVPVRSHLFDSMLRAERYLFFSNWGQMMVSAAEGFNSFVILMEDHTSSWRHLALLIGRALR
jgi:hypothetical protein